MALQRVKGQAVEMSLVLAGQVQRSINSITDFSLEPSLETISQGFLGEKSERKDNIYKGAKFKFSLQIATAEVLQIWRAIIDGSKQRNPGPSITIKVTLNMPDGTTPRIVIPNCFFGGMPLSVGGRAEYVKIDLDGEAEDFSVIS